MAAARSRRPAESARPPSPPPSPPDGAVGGRQSLQRPPDPAAAVAALYATNALSLIRLAHIMLGNRAAAEDVVQEAFCGLYRRWHHLADTSRAPGYLRTSVLNGCRSLLRQSPAQELGAAREPVVGSAESAVLASEERAAVIRALRKLPDRHREVLVLRYYLELPDHQIAADLEISPITVRSARRRALMSLRRLLKEDT